MHCWEKKPGRLAYRIPKKVSLPTLKVRSSQVKKGKRDKMKGKEEDEKRKEYSKEEVSGNRLEKCGLCIVIEIQWDLYIIICSCMCVYYLLFPLKNVK